MIHISEYNTNDPLLDMFLFETSQLTEQLELIILNCESDQCFTLDAINEIFRIMHTIKGSSAMMQFHPISTLAHSIEDLFYFLRDEKPKNINFSVLSDIILESIDFIKNESDNIRQGFPADGDSGKLTELLKNLLSELKKENSIPIPEQQKAGSTIDLEEQPAAAEVTDSYRNEYKAVIWFEKDCEMENMRAFSVIRDLEDKAGEISYIPEDILDNDNSSKTICQDGFSIYFKSNYDYGILYDILMNTIFLKSLELIQLNQADDKSLICNQNSNGTDRNTDSLHSHNKTGKEIEKENQSTAIQQSIISVSVAKLDRLMDLVGEMVIAEAMVIQNPDLYGLELENFEKASRHLSKITSEMQDMVMSVRMVSLSATFHKMFRIVRDMSKNLNKEVKLEILGEETEVDKNIIEHISDPLMHLVRNALDHGIEKPDERTLKGKPKAGTITLEAKNSGSDVLIIVKDDGKGLNKDKILEKAAEIAILPEKIEQLTDKEIFNLIFLPGFSTKDNISEYSGRGVGMDVVTKNIEAINGSVAVESIPDTGTTITVKIPLTLAIVDGMNIKVGESYYTIPTISIKESFRPGERDVFKDPDGNEMIMIRGLCHPVIRLHKLFSVKTQIVDVTRGIIIMLEHDGETFCLFADELIGQQQIVVKSLPEYIQRLKRIQGLAGCTLLGDGSISLILDIGGIIKLAIKQKNK